jgi:hypothetical protein
MTGRLDEWIWLLMENGVTRTCVDIFGSDSEDVDVGPLGYEAVWTCRYVPVCSSRMSSYKSVWHYNPANQHWYVLC